MRASALALLRSFRPSIDDSAPVDEARNYVQIFDQEPYDRLDRYVASRQMKLVEINETVRSIRMKMGPRDATSAGWMPVKPNYGILGGLGDFVNPTGRANDPGALIVA